MRTLTRGIALTVATLLLAGCGYFRSGTWIDDRGNWGRAFASTKPDDVQVVHSYYWRSPHWTREFEYFFEVAPNAQLRSQLFRENRLVQLIGEDALRAKKDHFSAEPTWFAPKAVETYEVWMYATEPRGNFTILIDKATGTIFLNDYQA